MCCFGSFLLVFSSCIFPARSSPGFYTEHGQLFAWIGSAETQLWPYKAPNTGCDIRFWCGMSREVAGQHSPMFSSSASITCYPLSSAIFGWFCFPLEKVHGKRISFKVTLCSEMEECSRCRSRERGREDVLCSWGLERSCSSWAGEQGWDAAALPITPRPRGVSRWGPTGKGPTAKVGCFCGPTPPRGQAHKCLAFRAKGGRNSSRQVPCRNSQAVFFSK